MAGQELPIFLNWLMNDKRFRLTYDLSSAWSSTIYAELYADTLEPILREMIAAIRQSGHSAFATGPFSLRGVIFNRDLGLAVRLAELAPEAADLCPLALSTVTMPTLLSSAHLKAIGQESLIRVP